MMFETRMCALLICFLVNDDAGLAYPEFQNSGKPGSNIKKKNFIYVEHFKLSSTIEAWVCL
jgi:hypothetical protein